jgi:protein-disulfide isomerase
MDDQPAFSEPQPTSEVGSDRISFKRSYFYLLVAPVAFVVGLAVGFLFWGRAGSPPAAQAPQAAAAEQGQAQQQAYKRYDVPEDDDYTIGPENAPITIIEFSDYECPFCRRWYQETYLRLREEYGDRVRIVYRDFPLYSIHPEAEPAALAANCAGEQGKYWEYHDLLFSSEGLGEEYYLQFAEQLGLDAGQFKACLESEKYKDEVTADYEFASNLGVNSTPTFFVNGIPVVGAQPFDVFQQIIEKELAGELP